MIGGTILVFLAGVSMVAGMSMALPVHRQFPPASDGLRGSAWLHLPTEQATQFESIARNVSRNCSILFTMPGMGSFNMWSGVATPNGWNVPLWMQLFSSGRQAEILSIMKSDAQACAIVNRSLVQDEAGVAALPLAHYVMTDMPTVAQFGRYEIHVHPNRSTPWFDVGEVRAQ
jgi:hypothetical protein